MDVSLNGDCQTRHPASARIAPQPVARHGEDKPSGGFSPAGRFNRGKGQRPAGLLI
ncbi:hypothetical protein [Cupriavidus basilensis]|uniref:hypothetical protein n=1 Tax=Cupriavidus basilensis TaxID=68895 RepID=UPI00130D9153|nr:hypothetical protein [Cupriavidus basilensis]